MWKRKYSLKEQYGTLGHFLKGDEPCHYIGQRYMEGTNIMARREWRGVADTTVAFCDWIKTWGKMLMLGIKLPVRLPLAIFRYRWFLAYMLNPAATDRWTEGLRGVALRCNLAIIGGMVSETLDIFYKTFRADANLDWNGRKNKYHDKTIAFDFSLPLHLIYAFPGYDAVNIMQQVGFMLPLFRRSFGEYYPDLTVSVGVPGDGCNLLLTEVGVAVAQEFPDIGSFWLSTNNPCDANVMGTSAIARHMSRNGEKPSHVLSSPLLYDDPTTREFGLHELECGIQFLEQQTGQKFQWEPFLAQLERTNVVNEQELERWDIFAKTDCGCVMPEVQNLYRMYVYQIGGDKFLTKASTLSLKYCQEAVRKNINPFPHTKWRALGWSCEPTYFETLNNWIYNCWGVRVIINMDSLTGHNIFDTSDKKEAMIDLADCHTHTIMRTHTVGGNRHLLQMWETAEKFNCNFIVMYDDVNCKNVATAQGLLEDEIRKYQDKYPIMWVPHSLMDPRVVPPAETRKAVNDYMTTVMHAEPLDPSLVDYDDSKGW